MNSESRFTKLLPKHFCKLAGIFLASSIGIRQAHAQEALVTDSLVVSSRGGLENNLQGTAAGLRIRNWSGTPGTQSIINLRGFSLDPTDASSMPLIMINGVPIIASPSNVTAINPLSYYSPEQIERIEIIKSIDRLAAYGVQAPNGAINLILKTGKTGPLHLRGTASAGVNFLNDFNYRKDAFYGFNTIARREVFDRTSIIHEQNLIVDGGGDYGSYLFGLNNYQDNGILNSTKFGRQSLFLNASYNITPKLTAHFYNNLTLANRDGRYAGEYNRNLRLPVISDETFFMDKKRNIALLSSIGLNYRFSPEFSLSSVAGISYEGSSRDMYVPSNILQGSIYASSQAYKRQLITINTSANYRRSFSDNWKMDIKLGHELRTINNRLTEVDGSRNLESGGSNYVKVVTGYNANQTGALSDHNTENLIGFYGIWKWDYRNALRLNLVLRTDGSSLYRHKWAFYPAFGLEYDLEQKLKFPLTVNAAIGKTGMLNRPQVFNGELVAKGDYYNNNELGVGQLYAAFPNAKSVDISQVDFGVTYRITSQIKFRANYFNKIYQDFIYRRYLSNIEGSDYRYETGGKIGLDGFEFTLDGMWIQKGHFSWSGNLNLAAYNNRVKALPSDIPNTSLAHLSGLAKGDPLTSVIAQEGLQRKLIGNTEAKFFGGLTNTFRLKNISLGVVFSYASGADVIAESFDSRYPASAVSSEFPLKSAETPYYFIQGDDRNPVYQGIRTIETGSFIRLSRANVAFHLGSYLKKFKNIDDAQLFIRGDNLLTFSRYSGINPEENITGIRNSNLGLTGTPLPAIAVLGFKIVF